ncbi:hypothetical protein Acr_16g0007790 [Actinidia rufa]|uniref:Uncharacterized protein n=1 Tax=Actinidia rufa TaxID=165716 RepID=A0A7J0FZM5_9ERIC|nr:hypothetical protein Acr_16g0007790 [Actinidia rufa]
MAMPSISLSVSSPPTTTSPSAGVTRQFICKPPSLALSPPHDLRRRTGIVSGHRRLQIVCMAPMPQRITRRSPQDFPAKNNLEVHEWDSCSLAANGNFEWPLEARGRVHGIASSHRRPRVVRMKLEEERMTRCSVLNSPPVLILGLCFIVCTMGKHGFGSTCLNWLELVVVGNLDT